MYNTINNNNNNKYSISGVLKKKLGRLTPKKKINKSKTRCVISKQRKRARNIHKKKQTATIKLFHIVRLSDYIFSVLIVNVSFALLVRVLLIK